jgi:hypothetical protein
MVVFGLFFLLRILGRCLFGNIGRLVCRTDIQGFACFFALPMVIYLVAA